MLPFPVLLEKSQIFGGKAKGKRISNAQHSSDRTGPIK